MPCETYTISQVSEITGVNSITLRAWQRRYGLIKPARNSSGHRFYTHDDLELIKQVLSWINKGVSIGKVKPLLDGKGVAPTEFETVDEFDGFIAALNRFDAPKLRSLFNECSKQYPFSLLIDKLITPLIAHISLDMNPLVDVQKSLLSAIIAEKCASLIGKLRKKAKYRALIISFDENEYLTWLHALNLSQNNYKVTVLPYLKGNTIHLDALFANQVIDKLVIVGENKLPSTRLTQLKRTLKKLPCPYQLQGPISEIHKDELNLV